MRYIVDLTSDMSDRINRLISEGRYRSIQEFLLASAQNQLYVVEQSQGDTNPSVELAAGSQSPAVAPIQRISGTASSLCQLLNPELGKVETTPVPEPNQLEDELHGLWNRLFTAKITTRVLVNMLKGNASSIPLESLQENASLTAREFGRLLLRKEKELGRKRSEMIATALPTKRDEFKSRLRFESHFVGYLSKNKIGGAPATLRFLSMLRDEKDRVQVGITAAGLKFASLMNPVIDRGELNSSFSAEERRFILAHLAAELPKEIKKMRFALGAVQGGATDPGSLQDELKKPKPKLNSNELTTLRAGLLSRLCELGLMARVRSGLSVRYELTSAGENWLKETQQ